MATKVKSGEKRAKGWLYFVKGDRLDVWKTKMARGRKKKKTTKKKATKKRTTKKRVVRKTTQRKTTRRKTTRRRR